MHTLRPVTRYAAALLLFLQCVLPACISVADAWTTRAGGATAAHAEQLGGPGTCATVHPIDCDLCAFVHLAISAAPSVGRASDVHVECTVPHAAQATVTVPEFRAGFSSRAPPYSSA